jgi:hypothetical protein
MNYNIRVCSDNLLLRGKLCTFLKLEVSDGSRQREVAVNSSEIDKSSGGCDPCFLAYKEVSKRTNLLLSALVPSFCGL